MSFKSYLAGVFSGCGALSLFDQHHGVAAACLFIGTIFIAWCIDEEMRKR